MKRLIALLIGFLCAAMPLLAHAQTADASSSERLALDIREEVVRLNVAVPNPGGADAMGRIAVTTYRPQGAGPFPVVVMSHGRAPPARRATPQRQRYEVLARYLVNKGFAVVVPTRLGYGQTFGQADPEAGGACAAVRFEAMSTAVAEQVLQVMAHVRTQPWADATRWVAMGQSVGGMGTVALAWRRPPGLVAAINFAGGAGGNPDTRPGEPCAPALLEQLWRERAAHAPVPMLWLYWRNDQYWGEHWPQRWAEAYAQGGARLEFHHLAAVGKDGHGGASNDMDAWVPLAEAFLRSAGFAKPGGVPRPVAQTAIRIDDLAALPAGANTREAYRSKFLAGQLPRAFAIGPGGQFGWATGDWAMGRALGYCAGARGQPCQLYAVDDDVVWAP